jgi:hypothetical protein
MGRRARRREHEEGFVPDIPVVVRRDVTVTPGVASASGTATPDEENED